MTPLVWANFPLALLFVLAVAGIPLWMTFKRGQDEPDFSEARAYLRATEALARGEATAPSGLITARRHAGTARPVPGRRHATPATAERTHPAGTGSTTQHTGVSV